MKKLIVLVSLLFLVGIIDTLYIFSNDKEISSITKSKDVKENSVKKVVKENIKEENETNNQVKPDCSLYSYEVPNVESNYIKEETEEKVNNDYVNNQIKKEDEEIQPIYEENIVQEESKEVINQVSNDLQVGDKAPCNVVLTEKEEEKETEEKEDEVITKEASENVAADELDVSSNTLHLENNNLKNGFYDENGNTYYYENDVKVTGLKNIDGVNHYFSPSGKYLGTTKVKVVDVSYYQGDINWDLFASESDCYGVILRLGYYDTLDKKFERNINEVKRLGIPYGIYLFSYSTTLTGAKKEAVFTNNMIDKYDLNPTLGIYYDIESWSSSNGSSSNEISKDMYDKIVKTYADEVSSHVNSNYKVKVYSGRWYAMNRLGSLSKSYVDWVAEYNSTLKYDGPYSMWQYTSKGSVPGITGNVDISYLY